MKYAVTIDDLTTEFGTYQEALMYALSKGKLSSSVSEMEDATTTLAPDSIELYEQKVEAGYPIPNTSYALALKEEDRAQFTGMLILIRELLDAGYITGDTTQSIKDKNDNIIEMTTTEFRSLMIGYGIYYKTIWNQCAPVSQ